MRVDDVAGRICQTLVADAGLAGRGHGDVAGKAQSYPTCLLIVYQCMPPATEAGCYPPSSLLTVHPPPLLLRPDRVPVPAKSSLGLCNFLTKELQVTPGPGCWGWRWLRQASWQRFGRPWAGVPPSCPRCFRRRRWRRTK